MDFQFAVKDEGGYAEPIWTDEGAAFYPVVDAKTSAVGYRVEHPDRPTRYVFLNPSGGNDTEDVDDTNVFVYVEDARKGMTPCNAIFYVNIWEKEEG